MSIGIKSTRDFLLNFETIKDEGVLDLTNFKINKVVHIELELLIKYNICIKSIVDLDLHSFEIQKMFYILQTHFLHTIEYVFVDATIPFPNEILISREINLVQFETNLYLIVRTTDVRKFTKLISIIGDRLKYYFVALQLFSNNTSNKFDLREINYIIKFIETNKFLKDKYTYHGNLDIRIIPNEHHCQLTFILRKNNL